MSLVTSSDQGSTSSQDGRTDPLHVSLKITDDKEQPITFGSYISVTSRRRRKLVLKTKVQQ